MRFKCLAIPFIAGCATLAAWAGPIKDPQMGLDAGSLSSPILVGVTFVPGANGGGAFGFFNPNSSNIIALFFDTTILQHLSQQLIQTTFSCNNQNTPVHPNPYFTNCSINYTPATGDLRIGFFGLDTGEQVTDRGRRDNDFEDFQAHLGIPPLPPGCSETPDSPNCIGQGHFIVTLNDNFVPTGDNGGWSTTKTPGVFQAGGPVFTVVEIDLAPEPETIGMVFAALAGIVFAKRRRVKR